MGREALCYGELGEEAGEVRALLESHELKLRGDIKATLAFTELQGAKVRGDALEAQTPRGLLRLHLGKIEARKWLDRIEHPPTLAQKLGIGPGTPVHVVSMPPEGAEVLAQAGAVIGDFAGAKLVFVAIASQDDLRALDHLARKLLSDAQLWVLRQKGKGAVVKEVEIMGVLRAQGLAPSKTAAWSEEYAADRYGRARGAP